MTVCIAGIVRWEYGKEDMGHAVVAVTDRMLTLGDFEYEPPQRKVGWLSDRALVLVSGAFPVHAEAIQNTKVQLSHSPSSNIREIAEIYGGYVHKYRLREAVQIYLAPLGLDETTFQAAQSNMAPHVVADLISQMQNHYLGAEAIVSGHDGVQPHIFHIDGRGFVTCHNDPGFVTNRHRKHPC